MEKWNSNFKLLVLFGMVWWYEDMVMMLDLCFKTVCVHGMVWRCGTSVTFVGQKNSLQLCTLWQTVSNTLNMGFTVSLFPLCIKGDNFHHQTAPHAVNVSKEGKNKINGHPINAKWWSSWGDDMRMYHMFLSKHYICRNHILLVQENAIIWRRKTTKNEDGGQQNSKKKRASSGQEAKRPPCPLPRTLLQSTSSTREHSFGETAVLCQKRIWESATGRHPKKKKGPDPWNGGHFFSRQPVPFWKHLRIFILLFCFMVYICWSCILKT